MLPLWGLALSHLVALGVGIAIGAWLIASAKRED